MPNNKRRVMSFVCGLVLVGLAACGGLPSVSPNSMRNTDRPLPAAERAERDTADAGGTTSPDYAALPQSTTPEGYHVLGDPHAPIVMTHYSDFL